MIKYLDCADVLQCLLHYILTDDKPLNGEETADSENLAHEEEEAAANTCYYDKSKSFFDNLSCDDPRYPRFSTLLFWMPRAPSLCSDS